MDLQTLGITPIEGDSPGGSDIRYEPVFEELQAEVDRLSLPSAAGEAIDWPKIASMAADILANQAKDLLVAGYFAVAQIHTNQLDGLSLGLTVHGDLLATFWDDLFPVKKRLRGRIAAIDWWLEKSETALAFVKLSSASPELKEKLIGQCDRINALLEEYIGESAPDTRAIARYIEQLADAENTVPAKQGAASKKSKHPVVEEKPRPIAPAKTTPAPPSTSPVPAAGQLVADQDARTAMQSALQILVRTAPALHKENPASPIPYQLLRFGLWSAIETLPPVSEGRTLIPAPDPQVASMLKDIASRNDWQALIRAAENQLNQSPLWLDLNRFTVQALENLGQPFTKACDAVYRETGRLLERMPELKVMLFFDGSPMADQETLEWIRSLSAGNATLLTGSLAAPAADDRSETGELFTTRIQEAQDLLKNKKLLEAVTILQQEGRRSGSARERMRWRLALCRILISGRQPESALPIFDQLTDDIDRFQLATWEPSLALEACMVIWNGLQLLSKKAIHDRLDDTMQRITRLDPAVALQLVNQ